MNSAFLRTAIASLFLAAFASACLGQETGNVVPASIAPAPTSRIPPAAGINAPAPAPNVNHVRQLVRDVETNTDNIKSQGDFGAQLWLIQGQEFFQEWLKPATPSIDPVTIAPRGDNVYTVIIFYGLAHDTKGLSNVTYDITVHRPDGSIYSDSKNLIGWQGLAPQQARSLELGRDHVTINFSATDPAGLYTVDVVVRDNVSRVELPLKQAVVVQ